MSVTSISVPTSLLPIERVLDVRLLSLLAAEPDATGPDTTSAILQLTPAVAWSAIVVQWFVVQFYQRGESLHKDYWGSGKINSAIAAIEAGRLIPSLARMFSVAVSKQEDKRRRPESEMEDLLQSVEFIPDRVHSQNADPETQ